MRYYLLIILLLFGVGGHSLFSQSVANRFLLVDTTLQNLNQADRNYIKKNYQVIVRTGQSSEEIETIVAKDIYIRGIIINYGGVYYLYDREGHVKGTVPPISPVELAQREINYPARDVYHDDLINGSAYSYLYGEGLKPIPRQPNSIQSTIGILSGIHQNNNVYPFWTSYGTSSNIGSITDPEDLTVTSNSNYSKVAVYGQWFSYGFGAASTVMDSLIDYQNLRQKHRIQEIYTNGME